MNENAFPPLTDFMPHRAPMLMLDRLVQHDSECAVTERTFQSGQLFVDEGGVSPFVALELFAQTAAAHVGYDGLVRGGEVRSGALLGTRSLATHTKLLPLGRLLTVTVRQVFLMPPVAQYECQLHDGPECLAEGSINVAMGEGP